MNATTRRGALGAAALLTCLPRASRAQPRWPDRRIVIVAPFPPGGQADVAARPVALAMQRILGQPVLVENRPGAGGGIGHTHVAKAPADGYTLLMALPSVLFIPEADRLRERPPSYRVADFAPIGRVLADAQLLAVRADSPWRTMADLIGDAKQRPETITYASSGVYGTLHIATEMWAQAAGVRLLHVPYGGAAPAMTAVLSGTTDVVATTPGTLKPQVDAGKLRLLANFGARRSPSFPDVATCAEQGLAGVEYYNWAGLFAPAATPQPVLAALRASLAQSLADPEVVRAFETAGAELAPLDAGAFADFLTADAERLLPVVRRIGRID